MPLGSVWAFTGESTMEHFQSNFIPLYVKLSYPWFEAIICQYQWFCMLVTMLQKALPGVYGIFLQNDHCSKIIGLHKSHLHLNWQPQWNHWQNIILILNLLPFIFPPSLFLASFIFLEFNSLMNFSFSSFDMELKVDIISFLRWSSTLIQSALPIQLALALLQAKPMYHCAWLFTHYKKRRFPRSSCSSHLFLFSPTFSSINFEILFHLRSVYDSGTVTKLILLFHSKNLMLSTPSSFQSMDSKWILFNVFLILNSCNFGRHEMGASYCKICITCFPLCQCLISPTNFSTVSDSADDSFFLHS